MLKNKVELINYPLRKGRKQRSWSNQQVGGKRLTFIQHDCIAGVLIGALLNHFIYYSELCCEIIVAISFNL